jgi:hypothetical protein
VGAVLSLFALLAGCAGTDSSSHLQTTVSGSTSSSHLQTTFPSSTSTTALSQGSGGPLEHITALAVGPSGSLHVVDDVQHEVFVRLRSGQFQLVAGNGTSGFSGDGGPATSAELSSVSDIAFSPAGELYIADGPRIRVVDQRGIIRTIVGNGGSPATVVSGTPAVSASLGSPVSIAFSTSGVLYLTTGTQVSGSGQSLQATTRSQLLRLTPSGTLEDVPVTVTSGPGPHALSDFGSIAVGSDGSVYVASDDAGWSFYKIAAGQAIYLGYARRSGGNTTIVQAGPNGIVDVDSGPNILAVQGNGLTQAYAFLNADTPVVKSFVFVAYFAIGPGGTLYVDNLNGAFDPYQQIVQVVNGQATSLWQGATRPR